MLTRNDKCFFALAFYRQSMQEMFFAMDNDEKVILFRGQADYWWTEYQERRRESRSK
jgi:hypothetical protein